METVFIAKNKKSSHDLGFEVMEMIGLDFGGKKVLIKPNLTIKAEADSGIVTNPIFCEGIIDYLKKNGAKEIKIGEGTADDMNEVYRATGYLDLAKRTKVRLIDFNKDEIIEGTHLPKSILDFDILINLPVLKTHHIALATLGIKNLMGLFLPVEERDRAFHETLSSLRQKARKEGRQHLDKEEFQRAHIEISEKIIDLYKAIRAKIPTITVIDGFYGRDGNGFEIGETKNMGIAIAGWNAVAVDTVASYIMGFNPKLIHYLMLAQRERMGPSQLSKIKIEGVSPKTIRTPFKVVTAMEEEIS